MAATRSVAPTGPAVAPVDGIRVGIGGWVFAPWRDHFYPAGLAQKHELAYASRRMSAIEINGSFYRAPAPSSYAKWRSETPEGFVFSLKAPRYIVEARRLADTGKAVDAFIHGGLAELGERRGPIVWQLASRRDFDPDDIAGFLERLPRTLDGMALRHVLEVRNDSFMCDAFVSLARQHGIATVFTDSPAHPSFADVTADFVYARLMRSREEVASGYPDRELAAWAGRARTWAIGGVPSDLPRVDAAGPPAQPRDVFVFFISAAKARNPAAAQGLIAQLRRGGRADHAG